MTVKFRRTTRDRAFNQSLLQIVEYGRVALSQECNGGTGLTGTTGTSDAMCVICEKFTGTGIEARHNSDVKSKLCVQQDYLHMKTNNKDELPNHVFLNFAT